MSTPSAPRPLDRGIYERVRSEPARIRQMSLMQQIDLIRQAFSASWADAERFVTTTYSQPREFAFAFLEGELLTLQERYNALPSRHRPPAEDVDPITDVFYEACDLIAQRDTSQQT